MIVTTPIPSVSAATWSWRVRTSLIRLLAGKDVVVLNVKVYAHDATPLAPTHYPVSVLACGIEFFPDGRPEAEDA